jgi:hypothetical protein
MLTPTLAYDVWIDEALRSVIKRALRHVAEHGLPGQHHFYITFHTGAPGVEMAAELSARYPKEMTIVLQHQFWDLDVGEDAFSVTLKFQGRTNRLHIPFAAISGFGDPSVNFGVQLRAVGAAPTEPDEPRQPGTPADASGAGAGAGEVIALDTFRKK